MVPPSTKTSYWGTMESMEQEWSDSNFGSVRHCFKAGKISKEMGHGVSEVVSFYGL